METVKPQMIRSAAVIEVTDVIATADYFRDKLGFTSHGFWGEPPCFTIMARGMVTIFLDQSRTPRAVPLNQYWAAYVYVDDVEATFAEFTQRGADIVRGPDTMEHGCREFDVRTPDGHLIAFGQVLCPSPKGPGL